MSDYQEHDKIEYGIDESDMYEIDKLVLDESHK